MTALDLIRDAALDGVHLHLTGNGGVRAKGEPSKVEAWAPRLRERKAEIAAALASIRQPTPAEADELRRLIAHVYMHDGPEHVTRAFCLAMTDIDRALTCYRELARRHGFATEEAA